MATPWQPPPAGEAKPPSAASSNKPAQAPTPAQGPETKAEKPNSKPTLGKPPPRVKPFKCEHCYEKTIGWDADHLIHPRMDEATILRLSQKVQVSQTFSFLHTLFLKRVQYGFQGPIDGRAYQVATLYHTPNWTLRSQLDTKLNGWGIAERALTKNITAFLHLDFYVPRNLCFNKAYIQFKGDRFCTRAGLSASIERNPETRFLTWKPTMYTMSHVQGLTNRIKVGGKLSVLHESRDIAYAGSVEYDTGAGVVGVTATSAKTLIATCTRHIAHPNTPNDDNVTVAAKLKLDVANPQASNASLGYRFRFPFSNSVVSGAVNSLYQIRCTLENDLDFLAVRSFFHSRLNFQSNTYKFGLGFTMGGDFEDVRHDVNPIIGAFRR